MATLPPPSSVAEVEQLVKRLYKPGPAQMISQINDQLQKLQLSQDGWKLADALMASEDPNVRFFGALTFTVKLNNDGPSLDAETAQTVQMRLFYWLIRLVNQGEGGLVCKKLCSTLTTYFVRSPEPWESPLLHLAASFHRGDAVPPNEAEASNMNSLVTSLKPFQLQALLWFAGMLAEEVGRVDANVHTHAKFHAQMEHIVRDASTLMSWSFQQNGSFVKAEALRSFLTWINYAQPVWPRKPEALQYLRDLIGRATECLFDRELFQEALDIFRDILESYTSFFRPEDMEMLARVIYEYIRPSLESALFERESDGQHVLYGQFIIAFGCANIQQVVEDPDDQFGSRSIVKLHLDMNAADGYPGDDDQLSAQSIEFWNTYIEYVNDVLFSKDSDDPDPLWLSRAKTVLMQAFQQLWKKMLTPPSTVAQHWSDDEHEAFKEFRIDAADLFLSMFVLLQKEMLQHIIDLTTQSLNARHWQAVEASLFCLTTLADNILEDAANEDLMKCIFESSLFRDIADLAVNIPTQTRRTAIDLLGSYDQYIERNAVFLPEALRFLFAALELPGLATAASKSIASLCSTCRSSLTSELDGFLEQYDRFVKSDSCDPYTKQKVIGGIAAIVQAISPESAKIQPLTSLLRFVELDIEDARQLDAAAAEDDLIEAAGVGALDCLASIGKGMQVPEDAPVEIYDDDQHEHENQGSSYWESDPGRAVQQRIVRCFSALEVVGGYSTAIDAVCQVLRSGYTETQPGPFVLPPSVTVSFVQQCSVRTPLLESVLAAACMLITQHSRQGSKRIDQEVTLIYKAVNSFMESLGQPMEDPSVAMACIDTCHRLMPSYANVLFAEMGSSVMPFILSALAGPNTMPKKSACELSTRLFSMKHLSSNTGASPTDTQRRIDETTTAYGPQFGLALTMQIGGLAQRSELDVLCDPLRSMLMNQKSAQRWLSGGLMSETFPNPNIRTDQKIKFLRSAVSVQSDSKKLKEVVKTFWATCRGTVVNYAS